MISAAFIETVRRTGVRQWTFWLAALSAAAALTGSALFGVYPPGDLPLARAVQAVELPGWGPLSDLLYVSGLSPLFQLIGLAVAILLVARGHRLMAGFMILTVLARLLVFFPKELVGRPRPSPFLIEVSERAGGFSFPSGHVLGAVLLWGFIYFASEQLIAGQQARRWVQWASLGIIALMGLQRVSVGAHWPSDVLGAYLWGGVMLFALVKVYEICRRCQPSHARADDSS